MTFRNMRALCMCGLGLMSMAPLACNGSAKEAELMVAAIDQYRNASGDPDVVRAAEALAATRCENENVCRARDACLAASDPMRRALTLKREVEVGIAGIQPGDQSAGNLGLTRKLDEADGLLRASKEKLELCDVEEQGLRHRYHLAAR